MSAALATGSLFAALSAAYTPPTRLNAMRFNTVSMCATTPLDAKDVLLTFARRSTSEETKEAILNNLMQADDRGQATLDAALAEIDASGSLLANRRWPLPLPSKRAKLGGYKRLLADLMEEEPGGSARFQEGDDPRRRRFLLVLLRQLRKNSGGVWALERLADKKKARATSMSEMLERTPEGLETPKYEVVDSREASGWEVRRYDEFSVATTARDRAVTTDGPKLNQPTMPSAGGFQALAGYIFGKNAESEKMAMTTPVFTRPAKEGGSGMGEMAFVLPSRYWDGEAAPPKPLDNGVTIAREGGGALTSSAELACLWFGGFAGAGEVSRRKAELREVIEGDPAWEVVGEAEAEEPLLLQYNDPFTPPWARRNEVALPVRKVSA